MVEAQKIHIGVTALNTFFVWVGCCVAWGGVLFKYGPANAYYNRVTLDSGTMYWSDVSDVAPEYNDCKHASRAFATFMSFIFILLTAQIVLFYMRAKPHVGLISSFNSWEKIAKYELVIASVNTFMWFLCLCIFGGGCIDKLKKMPGVSGIESTGFVYIVLCFLWYIGIIVLLVYKRKNPHLSTWYGMPPSETGTGGYSDVNSGAYNPPAREGQSIGGVPHEGMMVHQQYPPPGGVAPAAGGMYAVQPTGMYAQAAPAAGGDGMKTSLIQGGISSDSAHINVTLTPQQAAAAAGYAAAAAHQGFQAAGNTTGGFHTEPIA